MSTLTHLCLFTDSLEPSGVGEHMLTLAAELAGRYRISFVCPPGAGGDPFLARAEAMGLDAIPEAVNRPERRTNFACWLREQDVAVFHGHAGIGWEGLDGVFAARQADVPVVLRTEHLPYLITDPMQRCEHGRIVNAIDGLIAVSHAAYRSFCAAGIPAEKLHAVQNGIRLRPVQEVGEDVRRTLGLPPQARLVLTIGRFTEQKGHVYLADALPALRHAVPDVHLLWVGNGPLEEDLRRQVGRLRLEDHVHFMGKRQDVPELLAQCDLFVLPSLFEGLPLILLEAMAASRPVVATRVCGSEETVVDGETGRLVPPCDPAALADAMIDALTQPERARAWGEAGRRRFERQFTAARMAEETSRLYQRLLCRATEGKA